MLNLQHFGLIASVLLIILVYLRRNSFWIVKWKGFTSIFDMLFEYFLNWLRLASTFGVAFDLLLKMQATLIVCWELAVPLSLSLFPTRVLFSWQTVEGCFWGESNRALSFSDFIRLASPLSPSVEAVKLIAPHRLTTITKRLYSTTQIVLCCRCFCSVPFRCH